jgi:hypothetical protein
MVRSVYSTHRFTEGKCRSALGAVVEERVLDRLAVAVEHQLVGALVVEGVAPAATDEVVGEVVDLAFLEVAGGEHVAARTALHDVVTHAGPEVVAVGATVEHVIAITAVERVVALVAEELVVPRTAVEVVGARATLEDIIALTAIEAVPDVAVQSVRATDEIVVAGAAAELDALIGVDLDIVVFVAAVDVDVRMGDEEAGAGEGHLVVAAIHADVDPAEPLGVRGLAAANRHDHDGHDLARLAARPDAGFDLDDVVLVVARDLEIRLDVDAAILVPPAVAVGFDRDDADVRGEERAPLELFDRGLLADHRVVAKDVGKQTDCLRRETGHR